MVRKQSKRCERRELRSWEMQRRRLACLRKVFLVRETGDRIQPCFCRPLSRAFIFRSRLPGAEAPGYFREVRCADLGARPSSTAYCLAAHFLLPTALITDRKSVV